MGDKCGRREGREIEETERKQLEEGAQMGCMLDRVRQLEGGGGKRAKKMRKKTRAHSRPSCKKGRAPLYVIFSLMWLVLAFHHDCGSVVDVWNNSSTLYNKNVEKDICL